MGSVKNWALGVKVLCSLCNSFVDETNLCQREFELTIFVNRTIPCSLVLRDIFIHFYLMTNCRADILHCLEADWLGMWSNACRPFHAVWGTWGQTQGYCYSGGSQTTLASTSPRDPPNDRLSLSTTGWGRGVPGVASQLTWRGSHRDKSQFTQGAVTLNDIFTGWLYSSFDNALATSFISLKDEREAENVISSLRQGRQWLRIKREGGAS